MKHTISFSALACLCICGFVFGDGSVACKVDRAVSGIKIISLRDGDFASGSQRMTAWYQVGGLGGRIGMFIGHPNTINRRDRAIIRFNLSQYLLPPFETISFEEVELQFNFANVIGKDRVRKIEVVHLNYGGDRIGGSDLANKNVEVVGCVTINKKSCGKMDGKAIKVFSLDVRKFILDDIAKGRKSSSFRFRDTAAEADGNKDFKPTGAVLFYKYEKYPLLKIKECK